MKKIIVVILMMIMITGCSMTDQQEVKSITQDVLNSEEVSIVKGLVLDNGYTLGELIDEGVGSPTYEIYDPAEDGNTYVTIKGNITYNDIPVVMTLQYKDIGDDNYEFHTLAYNDLPQSLIDTAAFFDYLIDTYEASIVDVEEVEATEVSETETIESTPEDDSDIVENAYFQFLGGSITSVAANYGVESTMTEFDGGNYYEYFIDGNRVLFVTEALDTKVIQVMLFGEDEVAGLRVGMPFEENETLIASYLTFFYDEEDGSTYLSYSIEGKVAIYRLDGETGNIATIILMEQSRWEESYYSNQY